MVIFYQLGHPRSRAKILETASLAINFGGLFLDAQETPSPTTLLMTGMANLRALTNHAFHCCCLPASSINEIFGSCVCSRRAQNIHLFSYIFNVAACVPILLRALAAFKINYFSQTLLTLFFWAGLTQASCHSIC